MKNHCVLHGRVFVLCCNFVLEMTALRIHVKRNRFKGATILFLLGGGGGGQEDYIGPGIFFSTETESCLFVLSAVSSWIFFSHEMRFILSR